MAANIKKAKCDESASEEQTLTEAQTGCERKAGRPAEWGGPAGDRSGLLAPDQFSVDVNVVDDDDTRAGLRSLVDD